MKRCFFLLLAISFVQLIAGQENVISEPNVTVKWAPTGLILGSLSLQAEYNIGGKSSLTGKIGIPVSVRHTFEYEDKDASFQMKATSFLAGYRMYLTRKHMKGLYLEPYFKYVHHSSEGTGIGKLDGRSVTMTFTNDYNAGGIGAQLGAQFFVGKRLVVDLFFLGPELNSARNNLKAVEATNTLTWTEVQASDAEKGIKEFLEQFPFIRNHTTIMVDRSNRTVTANFKGALPGYRAGISFGFAL